MIDAHTHTWILTRHTAVGSAAPYCKYECDCGEEIELSVAKYENLTEEVARYKEETKTLRAKIKKLVMYVKTLADANSDKG